MSAASLLTLVIFDFYEGRQHNIDDVCVEFCFILELIFTLVIFMKVPRQYFMLMLVLNFVTTVTSQVQSARHHQRAGYSALPSV